MTYDEIATKIVCTLIEKDAIVVSQYKDAETYLDAICSAYRQVYMTAFSCYNDN